LGMKLFEVVKRDIEDRRVRIVALSAICNLVNDFSPMRETLLRDGGMEKMVEFLETKDAALRLNAMWAFKNALYKATSNEKDTIIAAMGWERFSKFLDDEQVGVREQAFGMVRNIAASEEDTETLMQHIGVEHMLNAVERALNSSIDELVAAGIYSLASISSTGSLFLRHLILSRPGLLASIRQALMHRNVDVRRPAASCVVQLATSQSQRRLKDLKDSGIESQLIMMYHGPHGREDNSEVRDSVKKALMWFERTRSPAL